MTTACCQCLSLNHQMSNSTSNRQPARLPGGGSSCKRPMTPCASHQSFQHGCTLEEFPATYPETSTLKAATQASSASCWGAAWASCTAWSHSAQLTVQCWQPRSVQQHQPDGPDPPHPGFRVPDLNPDDDPAGARGGTSRCWCVQGWRCKLRRAWPSCTTQTWCTLISSPTTCCWMFLCRRWTPAHTPSPASRCNAFFPPLVSIQLPARACALNACLESQAVHSLRQQVFRVVAAINYGVFLFLHILVLLLLHGSILSACSPVIRAHATDASAFLPRACATASFAQMETTAARTCVTLSMLTHLR